MKYDNINYKKLSKLLLLTVPPNIVDDESSASTVAVREGLNISLTCKAKGNPEPKIVWKRENALKITVDRRKKGEKMKNNKNILCVQ
jgi:hypothetical protein